MLINFSNYPSEKWQSNQKKEAEKKYGKVMDMAFPTVDPEFDSDEVEAMVQEYIPRIQGLDPDAVLIMGEMTFTYKMIKKLKENSIPCIASTTQRRVQDKEGGQKVSIFKFIRFRKY